VKRLVIISCGRAKIWDKEPKAGPNKARDAYSSPYFRDNRRYAEKFGDRWLILSAKYGFIDPNFVIPGAYEVTFKKRTPRPIGDEALAEQVRVKRLASTYDLVEVIGGSDYAERVRRAFDGTGIRVTAPIEGLSLGKGWHEVQAQLRIGRAFGD
jgi:hypothetical protein